MNSGPWSSLWFVPTSLRDNDKEYKHKPGGGTKPKYFKRLYFLAIVHILRTAIQWNAILREKFEGLGSSTLHDKFQKWAIAGFFVGLWRRGLVEYDELKGIARAWPACGAQWCARPWRCAARLWNVIQTSSPQPARQAWYMCSRCRLRWAWSGYQVCHLSPEYDARRSLIRS